MNLGPAILVFPSGETLSLSLENWTIPSKRVAEPLAIESGLIEGEIVE